MQDRADHDHFEDRRTDSARDSLGERNAREQLLHCIRNGDVDLGNDPDRGALVDGQLCGLPRHLGDQLHSGGAGSDDCGLGAGQIVGIVPGRGVDDLAGKVVDTGDVGPMRLREETRRSQEVLGSDVRRAFDGYDPVRGILVPAGSVDHGTERHVLPQIVLVRDVIGVLLQFRARCEKAWTSSDWARTNTSR